MTGSTRLRCLAAFLCLWVVLAHAATVSYEVEGIGGRYADNVRAYIGEAPTATSRPEVERFVRQSRDKAAKALEALGYYNAGIDASVSGDADKGWKVVFRIKRGPPVRLRHVNVRVQGDAADDPAFSRLEKRLPLASGDVLDHGNYETAKSALRNEALARGYFDYKFSAHRIEVNTDEHWADVDLVLDSGPRYRLGPVQFSRTPFNEDLLQRLVPYKAGAPYDADTIASLNGRLIDSGYFKDVRVRTLRDQATDHTIPVAADVTAREPNTVGVGLGFSTDEGPRARFSWDKHWVNARGHQIFSDVQVSRVRQNVSSRYVIPLRDPVNDQLQFQAGLQSEHVQDTRSRKITVGTQRQQNFSSGWTRTQSLKLLHENYTLGSESGRATLVMPGIAFSRTRARGGIDPYWGDRQSYSIDVAEDHLLSTVSLARVTLSNKWLRSFGERNRISLRADLGAIETNDFSGVPSSLRFFAGGDQSVRGYAYQSLSPTNARGDLVGGRYLATGSIEYGYRFLPNWRAAVFTDAGNAFNSFTDTNYKVGSGFGLRWLSPVGPVRVDFAWGISEAGNPFRLHLSLGSPL